MENLYQKSLIFSDMAHAGQTYGKDEPYPVHLDEVVDTLAEFGYTSDDWKARGRLHDTIEDTDVTLQELRDHFGDEIAWDVWAVSGIGPNRKIRNQDIKNKILMFGERPAILKVADRITNVRRGGKKDMYRKEQKEFAAIEHLVPKEMWKVLEEALYGDG